MAEKLAQAIERAITFCGKVEFAKQPLNTEVVVSSENNRKSV
jgi:hypothetical protein